MKSTSRNTRHFAEAQRCRITLPCHIRFGEAKSGRRVIAGKKTDKPKAETPKPEPVKVELPLFLIAEREEFLRQQKAKKEQQALEAKVARDSMRRWPAAHDGVTIVEAPHRLDHAAQVEQAMAVHAERAWQEVEAA